ncbi:SPOR domain-containing protein [Inmirania thermothiophila]|uniref:DedD protein n=1 Tax=Inmirania thermothiophila TaxID=1750597 RepID=A0A3N1Y1X9_9GAMM|nr:SPOR domain-containing protein [Inmirania thermothiophila]ROR32830.1 DedD protein [Inmirania thermothiophila]
MQQRLVGAVVLVALAVIFVPMILERGGGALPEAAIPPRPEIPPALDRAPEPVAPPQVAAVPPRQPEPAPQVPVPPQAREAAEAARAIPPAEAWVVQVGSFGRRDNAVALRDRLRKAGFTAFIEEAEAGGETAYRVRVGPELGEDEAKALQRRLAGEQGLEGVVLRLR